VENSHFVPTGYRLVWNDEFDGVKIDPQKWRVRYPGARGAGWISEDAISLDGKGHLLLTTREQDGKLLNGHVGTAENFQHTFGYWESRLQFEKGAGQHGCFWLQSNAAKVPGDPKKSGVEVDIAEFFGPGRKDGGLGVNVYWQGSDNTLKRAGGIVDLGKVLPPPEQGQRRTELNEVFHVYGLLWTPTTYTFFIDGIEVFKTHDGVSHQPAYAVLSLFTADWEVTRLDRKSLPDSMIIDYVRVYDPENPVLP
jgi:beta-glucanase (GH16 family)